jgi:phenylpropionate dioxygenase-like ring-hydroxylating dioxygenase large terminal subunit
MNRKNFSLKRIETEIFHGFIFLRFVPGPQPPVARLLAAFDADFASYGLEELLPVSLEPWSFELPVNWKSIRDVDNESYHVPYSHPGLHELFGGSYREYFLEDGLSVSAGWFDELPRKRWSVRNYTKLSPERRDLPEYLQKAWTYFMLFPNQVFAVTPEGMQFYHDLPESAELTRLTGRIYRWANETRECRLARYLSYRIDRETTNEDRNLTVWSNTAMRSSGFEGYYLSDLEFGVRRFHDQLRAALPAMKFDSPPTKDHMPERNRLL